METVNATKDKIAIDDNDPLISRRTFVIGSTVAAVALASGLSLALKDTEQYPVTATHEASFVLTDDNTALRNSPSHTNSVLGVDISCAESTTGYLFNEGPVKEITGDDGEQWLEVDSSTLVQVAAREDCRNPSDTALFIPMEDITTIHIVPNS